MKNTVKSTVRLIAALIITVMLMTSMTSCFFFDFGFDLDEFFEDNFNQNPDGDNPPDDEGGNGNQGGGTTDDPVDEDLSFIPSGDATADSATALNRALLSTVVVESRFSSGPAYGSGVIYQLDSNLGSAYIITNCHVVYDSVDGFCGDVNVYLYGMELQRYAIDATVVGGSVTYDIAILKVTNSEVLKNAVCTKAAFGNSDDVGVFDSVYAIGNPEAQGIAVTKGIVSVASEYLELTGADDSSIELRVIRTDAAVNGGNSGGGLYNEQGQLVGIVSAKLIGSEIDNMGYAIPANLVKCIIDNLIDNYDGTNVSSVKRVLLGVTITSRTMGVVVDGETGEVKKVGIVEVDSVNADALVAGKVQKGDVITSLTVDGVTVNPTQIYHVTDHMLTARVGNMVELMIDRNGEAVRVTFVVEAGKITTVK